MKKIILASLIAATFNIGHAQPTKCPLPYYIKKTPLTQINQYRGEYTASFHDAFGDRFIWTVSVPLGKAASEEEARKNLPHALETLELMSGVNYNPHYGWYTCDYENAYGKGRSMWYRNMFLLT